MMKIIIKNLKLIISLLLMLSITFPNYATLNASDGSAFVTKAEFDSALADFNAKMTSFESEINSKIDSQVTSYLDRNGIWSGKDQEFKDNAGYFYFLQKLTKDATEEKTVYTRYYTYDNSSVNHEGYYARSKSQTLNCGIYECPSDEKVVAVESINKSGLCIMPYELRMIYCTTNEDKTKVDSNFKNNKNMAGGGNYWIMKFFAASEADRKKNKLASYTTTQPHWQGLYFYCTNLFTFTNLNIAHNFRIYENDELKYDYLVNNMCLESSRQGTQSWSDGNGFLCENFGDPIFNPVACFFVSKGSKLNFVSHVNFTGWCPEQFVQHSTYYNAYVSFIVKPTSIVVY